MDITALQQLYSTALETGLKLSDDYKGKEDQIPPEVAQQMNSWFGKADEYKALLDTAERAQKGREALNQPATNPLAWRQSAPGEGNDDYDGQSWREMEVKTLFGPKKVRWYERRFLDDVKKAKTYTHAFEGWMRVKPWDETDKIGPQDWKTLSEGVDTAGGFTVPPDFHADVIKKEMTLTQFRPNCRVITTSRDLVRWPKINYTTDNNFTSPVRMTWSGEAPATATSTRVTDPGFGLYNIAIHTAIATWPISFDLMEDTAVDLVTLASDLFAEAFSLGEDTAFATGPGVNQPMGITSEIGTNGPSSTAGTGSATFTADDLIKTYLAVPIQYRMKGSWLMNTPAMQIAELLKDTQNRYLVQSLTDGSLQSGQFDMLKNRPVLIDEFMPSILTGNSPILYGDMTGYLIIDRVGLAVQKLREVYAELNVMLMLARKRVGGYCIEPWKFNALKLS